MTENDVNAPINNDPMKKKETNLSTTPRILLYSKTQDAKIILCTSPDDSSLSDQAGFWLIVMQDCQNDLYTTNMH